MIHPFIGSEPILLIYEFIYVGGFSYICHNSNRFEEFEIYTGTSLESIRKQAQSHICKYSGTFDSEDTNYH